MHVCEEQIAKLEVIKLLKEFQLEKYIFNKQDAIIK